MPKENSNNNPESEENGVGKPESPLTRLPPWKGAYDAMAKDNLLIDGVVIREDFFAKILGPRNTRQFGEQLNLLILHLEHWHGLHMCQRQGDYTIVRVERTDRLMANRDNKIARSIARNKRFGEAVLREHSDRLSDSDKRKIQRKIERNGSLLLFHCKPDVAVKALKEVAKETLEKMNNKSKKFLELRVDDASAADIETD